MRALTPVDIVGIWELGQQRPDWQKALITLAKALPDMEPAAVSALSLAHRNALLFELRQAVVGPVMRALVKCPRCGEPLEFDQIIAELLADYRPPDRTEFEFLSGEFAVRYRLLTSDDVAAAAGRLSLPDARSALIDRAIVAVTRQGEPIAAEALPAEIADGLGDDMKAADPLADVGIRLACAACEHEWSALLDIASFLWTEIETQARQVLEDVVTIARHYGWGEGEILGMTPARRAYYLEAIA